MLQQAAGLPPRPCSAGTGQAAHSDGGDGLVLGPVRSSTVTWAEMRSIASLMPQYWVAQAGAGTTDPGSDRGGGGSGG